MKKILIVEDELVGALLLKRVLMKGGYEVVLANNGSEAIEHLRKEKFDAVLTDWMMPHTDGIELIKHIRKKIRPIPFLVLITALASDTAKQYALESGADDFLAKPVDIDDLLSRLRDGLERHTQDSPVVPVSIVTREIDVKPPHVCVAIASSTGGPPTLMHIFKNLEWKNNAAYLIVQHGPAWMLETYSDRLRKESGMPVHLVPSRLAIEPGAIYLAPGDKHIRVDRDSYHVILDNGPKENFVRPSAEPLFRSAADAYGKYCIGVVLTGLGRDGAQGAAKIASVKGTIIVQDPATCIAPSMPNTVIESGIPHRKVLYDDLPKAISETVFPIAAALKRS
ncbi:chemotaxis response regulator protein-glutamate methylesterase [Candidatus Kapaibacterium sp.]